MCLLVLEQHNEAIFFTTYILFVSKHVIHKYLIFHFLEPKIRVCVTHACMLYTRKYGTTQML
jgi:hypothetical protein